MKVLSTKVTAFLIKREIIPVQDKEIYEYGFELLLCDLLNFSIILTLGGVAKQFWFSVLYLIVFVGLRSFCGGYHAKTHLRCRLGTIGAFVLFLVFNAILHPANTSPVFVLLGNVIAFIPVWLFAPVPHGNKPLSAQLRKKNRYLAITLYLVLTAVSAVLLWNNRQEGIAISLTLWIVSLCILPAINSYSVKGGNIS